MASTRSSSSSRLTTSFTSPISKAFFASITKAVQSRAHAHVPGDRAGGLAFHQEGVLQMALDVVVVDVRPAVEFAAGHVPTAAYVDLDSALSGAPGSPVGEDGRHPLPSCHRRLRRTTARRCTNR